MIASMHIRDVNLMFQHIPKALYWIEIWWLWKPSEYRGLTVMLESEWRETNLRLLNFVTYVLSSQKKPSEHRYTVVMKSRRNNAQVGCGVFQLVLMCTKKNISHHPPKQGRMDPCFIPVKWHSRNWDWQYISNLLFSSFSEPVWILSSTAGVLFCSSAVHQL